MFLYGPVFNNMGSWADSSFIISIVLTLFSTAFPKPYLPNYSSYFLILFPFFFAVVLVAIFFPGIEVGDISKIIIRPFRILFTLIAGYTLVRVIKRYYDSDFSEKIFEFIFLSVFIHASIMLLQFFNPDFKDLVYKYTASGDYRSSFDYNFRMGGLSGGTGGAILSVVQSIGIIVMPFLFRSITKTKKIVYSLLALAIFSSILVCGRSGLWSVILFTPISVFIADPKISTATIVKFSSLILLIVVVFIFIISSLGDLESDSPIVLALSRTLDTFLNFSDSGEFEDHTTSVLADHILIPNDFLTWLIGDTEHIVNAQFGRVLDSDIGYIRNLWSYGIIGAVIFVVPMIRTLVLSFNKRNQFISAGFLMILTILTLFFQLKENFMYTRMLFSIYSLIFAIFYFDQKKMEKSEHKTHMQ